MRLPYKKTVIFSFISFKLVFKVIFLQKELEDKVLDQKSIYQNLTECIYIKNFRFELILKTCIMFKNLIFSKSLLFIYYYFRLNELSKMLLIIGFKQKIIFSNQKLCSLFIYSFIWF